MQVFRYAWLVACLFITIVLPAQDPLRFEKEVKKLVAGDTAVQKKHLILFTGSSSIRMWGDIKVYYPNYNVVNRGFGGSVMSDLDYYTDKLILPYKPERIFIYEGDNDLSAGKKPEEILASADSILKKIRSRLSKKVPVYFISPKPSLARWKLKDQYILYNKVLKDWVSYQKNVIYIDMWTPLLDAEGFPRKDIFIDDGLHLNPKGYLIWSGVIEPYLH
ncbi:MAG TPA: GDSL-type esterase/lipase family protein [Ohtaekwangia sp.]|uniref:GDSL-type esterase/lipase family protein n=1 Tax=Ohtaekwangia sp. TaxID=2066019 RepID=UPI002F9293C4